MRGRSSSNTAADWQRIQPRLTDLYITQGKTLEDTIKLLEARYGFKASRKQCKVKMKEWKIGKHCSVRLHLVIARRKTDLSRIVMLCTFCVRSSALDHSRNAAELS